MPTLYVENVPADLHEALRERARQNRKSVAAEVVSLLEQNIATPAELKSREEFFQRIKRLQNRRQRTSTPFPSTEQMQREDRAR
jgi:antitoxin FitA